MGCCGSSEKQRQHPQYVPQTQNKSSPIRDPNQSGGPYQGLAGQDNNQNSNGAFSVPQRGDVSAPEAYGQQRRKTGPTDPAVLPTVSNGSAAEAPVAPGLYTATQEFMLRELLPSACPYGNIIVIDKIGIQVLEGFLKINDLTRAGIPLVDDIDMVRQPLKQMPAVYVVFPTPQNAKKIAADWDKNPNMYKEAHVILLDEMSASFRDILAKSQNLTIKLKTIKHLKLDFLCNSQHAYVLTKGIVDYEDTTTSMRKLFGYCPSIEANRCCNKIADSIVSALGCLGDRPSIRYQGGSQWAESVSGEVQRTMLRRLGPNKDRGSGGLLLILDRTIDVVTPLLHHFTYEAMLHDLQPIMDDVTVTEKFNGVFTASQTQPNGQPDKVTALDARDDPWQLLRYGHFDSIRRSVREEFKETLGSDAAKLHPEMREGGNITLNEFSAAVRQMPQFQKKIKDLSLHTSILIALGREMEAQHTVDYALVEQNFATSEHEDKENGGMKKLSRKTAWKQLMDIITVRDASTMAFFNKVRLLLIFVVTQNGISQREHGQVQEALYEIHPNEPSIERWLAGLAKLNIATEKEETHWWKTHKKKSRGNGKAEDGEEVYLVSRAVPRLKGVMTSALTGNLSFEEFPSMEQGGAPVIYNNGNGASKRDKPEWSHIKNTNDAQASLDKLKGPRLHVFVIGGVSPAELQAAAVLREHYGRDIVIGGTEYATPFSVLQDLEALQY
eukprot:TRINITY_DN1158_c0_g2_i1.p1 TRINITY_DN1158_c0_g2~~TRINITY_DN1158_c0_g2_i1.p1  ORF type:complete len:725 (+),score=166.11 TRINITY_DN1158_c0_g2_i1:37-2211(+)